MNGLLIPSGLIGAGLLVLVAGGELLVRGASRLAAAARISPLVIGLTVVAFGTSAPELAVSLQAGLGGEPDIALGNVIGSNILNILLILGISAAITPLVVASQLVRLDVPLMVAASFVVLAAGWDGQVVRWEGAAMFASLVMYIAWSIYKTRQEPAAVQAEFAGEFAPKTKATARAIAWQLVLILAGLGLLTVGARWLVSGATDIARLLGMSELLIGLTIVAAGTSLPEVAASVLASIKGERDIAVGNVVGSNLFNILCVLALTAVAAPAGVPVSDAALKFDIPVMIAVSVACLPIFFTGHLIARWEGVLFLAYYAAYTTYLILAATAESIARTFGGIMGGFVIPLTVLTLLIAAWRAWRRGNSSD